MGHKFKTSSKTNVHQDAITSAKQAESKFGSFPSNKTVASTESGQRTLSGWTDKEGFKQATDNVIRKAEEIGHNLRPHKLLDQGVPGRYNASHAEKQLSVIAPNEPIAVSRAMCSDCIPYFRQIAQTSGKVQIVSDPNYVRIFNADGTITELPK